MPHLTNVPAVIVDAVCARLRSEGLSSIASLSIVRTTQPLVTASSLRSLAQMYFKDIEASSMAQLITAATPPMNVEITGSSGCPWEPIDKLDPVAQAQTTVVEFSAPFPNPFARGEGGIFIRVSVGGQYAQWYWLPLAERQKRLGIGILRPMDLHEG